jgi:hypothetical protein
MNYVFGYALTVIFNIAAIAFAWGKIQQRLDSLEKRFEEERHRNTQEANDIKHIQMEAQRLGVALWGIDGNNGLRSQVRGVISKVEEIQRDISDISAHQIHIRAAIDAINTKLDK